MVHTELQRQIQVGAVPPDFVLPRDVYYQAEQKLDKKRRLSSLPRAELKRERQVLCELLLGDNSLEAQHKADTACEYARNWETFSLAFAIECDPPKPEWSHLLKAAFALVELDYSERVSRTVQREAEERTKVLEQVKLECWLRTLPVIERKKVLSLFRLQKCLEMVLFQKQHNRESLNDLLGKRKKRRFLEDCFPVKPLNLRPETAPNAPAL